MVVPTGEVMVSLALWRVGKRREEGVPGRFVWEEDVRPEPVRMWRGGEAMLRMFGGGCV